MPAAKDELLAEIVGHRPSLSAAAGASGLNLGRYAPYIRTVLSRDMCQVQGLQQ